MSTLVTLVQSRMGKMLPLLAAILGGKQTRSSCKQHLLDPMNMPFLILTPAPSLNIRNGYPPKSECGLQQLLVPIPISNSYSAHIPSERLSDSSLLVNAILRRQHQVRTLCLCKNLSATHDKGFVLGVAYSADGHNLHRVGVLVVVGAGVDVVRDELLVLAEANRNHALQEVYKLLCMRSV